MKVKLYYKDRCIDAKAIWQKGASPLLVHRECANTLCVPAEGEQCTAPAEDECEHSSTGTLYIHNAQ